MLLSHSPERERPSATSPCPVVVALCRNDRGALARAVALAADRRRVLHVVVHAPRPATPWALLAGGRPWRRSPEPVDHLADRLRAAGVHVEVHRTTGRPSGLAQDIAATCGGDLVA